MKRLLILPVLLLLVGNPASSADLQKGVDAAQSGDYATALREWTPLAEQGDAFAQTLLGAMAKFRDVKTLQKFSAVHASIHNHFNQDRHLNRRDIFKQNRAAALAEWGQLAA